MDRVGEAGDAETGHVLFLDLVGSSLHSVEEQARQVGVLLDCVRGTEEFQSASARREMVAVPSGDGVALVFFRFPAAPLRCARELATADHGLALRMGIHVGPVTRIHDIGGADSVVGGGINGAKRVMDCAAPGEVLLSAAAAAAVAENEAWRGQLHPRGTVLAKHDVRIELWQWIADGVESVRPPARPAPSPGGALPVTSERYVVRAVDPHFHAALDRGDPIVLLKGPRQVGKTSLLARSLARARARGTAVAVTDLQGLSVAELESAETTCRALAEGLCEHLGLAVAPEESWSETRSGAANLERYVRRVALDAAPDGLVWAIDEADRLFTCPFGSEIFGLFRSWHNRRALDPAGPWSRLTLAIAYAAEAHLFIDDPNQSPFNVGTPFALSDFTRDEVAELNRRCGAPLDNARIDAIHRLLGGQPFLCQRGIDAVAGDGLSVEELEALSLRDEGPFADHLKRLVVSLTREPALVEAVRRAVNGQPLADLGVFLRLRSAGILVGEGREDARLRCALYASYLRSRL